MQKDTDKNTEEKKPVSSEKPLDATRKLPPGFVNAPPAELPHYWGIKELEMPTHKQEQQARV